MLRHGSKQHGGMIREGWVIEVNLMAVTLKYNRRDMRYRAGKTRSYTSKRKDTKVTNKNSADTFENEEIMSILITICLMKQYHQRI